MELSRAVATTPDGLGAAIVPALRNRLGDQEMILHHKRMKPTHFNIHPIRTVMASGSRRWAVPQYSPENST